VPTDFGYFCPKGQPWLLPAVGVGLAGATPGGLVDGCQNALGAEIPNCSLTNTYFVGPNAQPGYFNPGNVTAGAYLNGGTPNDITHFFTVKGVQQMTNTAFALGSFKFNDHVEATLQLNWGYTSFGQDSYFANQLGSALIQSGNPFIPASIQSQMTAQGIQTLEMGTINTNPLTGPVPSTQYLVNTVGGTALFESRRLMRGVLGFDGDLGTNWTWAAYYERSETRQIEDGLNNLLVSARTNAENAVTVGNYTATYTAGAYPNPLGIPNGQIACASNLLPLNDPGETRNCAPLNIFGSGPGVASPAAIAYIQGVTHAGGEQNHTDLTQNVAAASIQGKLPIGTPAGPVALAAGVVYRNESGIKVNCGFNCDNVLFPLGKPKIGETIIDAYAVLVRQNFEWLSEALLIRHAPQGAPHVFDTPGFYTQISKAFGSYRPYFRYTYVNASNSEPVFPQVGLQSGPSVGVRYAASESVALKLQYDYTELRGQPSVSALALQVGFTF